MNLIVLERIIDKYGRRYFDTEIFEGEPGGTGQRGDKGEQGVGINGATLSDSGLTFELTDNQTDFVGQMPVKTLKIANYGEIEGENRSLFLTNKNPKFLCVNGILYHDSEYTLSGNTLTTTFNEADVPEGDLDVIFKEENE